MSRANRRRLYLFSSDQSPLYAQDILNVLGAPEGQPYTFRYDARYLSEDTRNQWASLPGTRVVVVFSLQQRARYHEPAFIPVRLGDVLSTSREGDSFFVVFRIGAYVSLKEPSVVDGRERPDERVRKFTGLLDGLSGVPYAVSASVGETVPDDAWDIDGEASVLFTRTGAYLSRTDTFADARFVRVLGLKPTGATDTERLKITDANPVFVLDAGRTYDLDVFYAQPVAPSSPEPFVVDVDETAVRTVGRAGFDVASRYDRATVRLAAAQAIGLEDRDTVVALEPGEDVQGPRVVLSVRVKASRGKAAGIAAGQTVALIAVALAGTLTMWPIGVRVVLAVAGAMAAVGIGLFGASALSTPTMP
ncbi:MAG: hypothetical protein ACLQMH_06120 [Solirubrobacteraceae bacterium]